MSMDYDYCNECGEVVGVSKIIICDKCLNKDDEEEDTQSKRKTKEVK